MAKKSSKNTNSLGKNRKKFQNAGLKTNTNQMRNKRFGQVGLEENSDEKEYDYTDWNWDSPNLTGRGLDITPISSDLLSPIGPIRTYNTQERAEMEKFAKMSPKEKQKYKDAYSGLATPPSQLRNIPAVQTDQFDAEQNIQPQLGQDQVLSLSEIETSVPQSVQEAQKLSQVSEGVETPRQKLRNPFENVKWNDAVQLGLYGVDAFLRRQDAIRNRRNYQRRLRNVFTQKPIYDYNYLYGPDSSGGTQYQSMIMAKHGANIRKGTSPDVTYVEVEGGEFIQLPDLSTQHIQGPSHAQGGVHTNLPEGTRVFSDFITPVGSKKTYAQIAKKYDIEPYKKVLDNPYASEPDRKTAQLMLRRNQSILNELFADQQVQNGNSDGTDQAEVMAKFGLDLKKGEKLSFTDPFEFGGQYLGGPAEFNYGGYYGNYFQDGGMFPSDSTFYGATYGDPSVLNLGTDVYGNAYFQYGGYSMQEGDKQVEAEAEARLRAQEEAAINQGAPISTNPEAFNDDASFGQNYKADLTAGFPPTTPTQIPQLNPMVNQQAIAAALDKDMPLTSPRKEQTEDDEEDRPLTFAEFKETQPKNISNPKLQKLYKDYIAGIYNIDTKKPDETLEDNEPLEAFKKAGYFGNGGVYYSPQGKKYKIPKDATVKEEGDKTIKTGDYVRKSDGTIVKVSKVQATRMAKSTSSSKAKDYAEGRLYLQGWSEESPENAAKLKLAEDAIAKGIKDGQIKETKPSGWKQGDPTQITILGNFKPSFKERMAISEVVNKTGKGFGTNSYQIVGQKATEGYAKTDQQGNYKGTGSFVGGMTPQDYEQRATYERALAEGMDPQQAEALATTTDSKQQIENRRRYLNEIGYNVDDVPNSVLAKDDFYKSNYADVTKAIENTFTQAGFRPAIGDDQLSGWEHYDAASYTRNPSYANIEVEEPPKGTPPGSTFPKVVPFKQVPSTPGKFQAYQAIPEAMGYLAGLNPYTYYTPDYTHTEIAPPTLNIDPELQSIDDSLQSTLRQSTGNPSVDSSRRAALFNQALAAKQQAFGRKQNFDAQARFQADQYNAQARDMESYRDVTSAANVYNEYMAVAQDAAERERLSAITSIVNKKAAHDADEYLKMMYFTTMYPQYYYEGTDRRNPIKFNPNAQEFYSRMANMYFNQVNLDQASQAVPASGATTSGSSGDPVTTVTTPKPPAPGNAVVQTPQGPQVVPASYMWGQPQMNPNINPNFGPTYNVADYPALDNYAESLDYSPVIIPDNDGWNWDNPSELKYGGVGKTKKKYKK